MLLDVQRGKLTSVCITERRRKHTSSPAVLMITEPFHYLYTQLNYANFISVSFLWLSA